MSNLEIKKTENYFEAKLTKVGYKKLPLKVFILAILLLVYGLIATILSFNEELGLQNTFIPYLVILFNFFSFIVLLASLLMMFSETQITLTPKDFILTRSFFGLQKIYTTDINNIFPICLEEVTLKLNFSRFNLIIIYDIAIKHFIGPWLEDEERNQLYHEMIQFLAQFNHDVIQYSSSN